MKILEENLIRNKYFALLHSSMKTSYTEGKSMVFSDLEGEFSASDFTAIENNIKKGKRWLGYFGYGLKNSVEKLPADKDLHIQTPDSWFGNFKKMDTYFGLDIAKQECTLPKIKYLKSNMTKDEYISKVKRIRKYIEEGAIYQANLTRKFYGEFETAPDAFAIYRKLNEISPAPYSAFLKMDDTYIISSSPELFIRVDADGNAITCPIKGSAGKGMGDKLQKSQKDRAENLMITDLMRNDFSRSCEPGSVRVEGLFDVDEFTTISHMHSTITGKLKKDESALGLIKNCFPPGSMTGAPKIRAMEICSELESHKRGIYSGALGYFDENGACEFSVVIRTIIIKGNKFEFQVGGGIVYDSVPEKELEETYIKARAIAETLGISEAIKDI